MSRGTWWWGRLSSFRKVNNQLRRSWWINDSWNTSWIVPKMDLYPNPSCIMRLLHISLCSGPRNDSRVLLLAWKRRSNDLCSGAYCIHDACVREIGVSLFGGFLFKVRLLRKEKDISCLEFPVTRDLADSSPSSSSDTVFDILRTKADNFLTTLEPPDICFVQTKNDWKFVAPLVL